VLLHVGGLDDDVVDIYLYRLAQEWLEDSIHQALVCSASVFETKGHDFVVKVGLLGYECGFDFVFICLAAPSTSLSMLGNG